MNDDQIGDLLQYLLEYVENNDFDNIVVRENFVDRYYLSDSCLLYTSPSPRDRG